MYKHLISELEDGQHNSPLRKHCISIWKGLFECKYKYIFRAKSKNLEKCFNIYAFIILQYQQSHITIKRTKHHKPTDYIHNVSQMVTKSKHKIENSKYHLFPHIDSSYCRNEHGRSILKDHMWTAKYFKVQKLQNMLQKLIYSTVHSWLEKLLRI